MTDRQFNPQTILVLDGEQRPALAVVRSLGEAGHRVLVGAGRSPSLAGSSRYAAAEHQLPDPLSQPRPFADAVAELVRRVNPSIVIPVTEASTLALLEAGGANPAILPTSSRETFLRASDKEGVLALAASIGIDTPPQWVVPAGAGIPAAITDADFPLVVKPARSIVGAASDRKKSGVQYARTRAELEAIIAGLALDESLLLQSKIEGPGVGVFLLRWNGKFLASFAHRRVREKPPSGGVSVCCESVAVEEELLGRSRQLLEALDWNGVAMVEYKRDARTGRNYLMEINPRFWGSLQLAVDAGVDFPALLVRAVSDAPLPPVNSWRTGIRSRWRLGEVDHLIARLRRSDADLGLPAGSPGRLATILTVLAPWRPRTRSEVFRWSDPRPGVREMIDWVRAL